MRFTVIASSIYLVAVSFRLFILSPEVMQKYQMGPHWRADLRDLGERQLIIMESICQSITAYAFAIGTSKSLYHGNCGRLLKIAS